MKKKIFFIALTVLFILSISTIVVQGKGNPWDAVWSAIGDLYSRIYALEPQEDHIEYIRFYDPSEHIVETDTTIIATYTITPNDPTNNAILNYYFYFESKGKGIVDCSILDVTGSISSTGIDVGGGSYKLSKVYRVDCESILPKPNSSFYTVRALISPDVGQVYLRNLNIIVEYMDGLPPNN